MSATSYQNIPAELRDRRQWAAGGADKQPINPANGENAKTNQPATWGTFDAAGTRMQADGLDSVGYVVSRDDPYTIADLDRAVDGDGTIKPWARALVGQLDTYTEYSPSAAGLRLICRGTLPTEQTGRTRNYHDGKVEIFDERKFFRLTGQRVDGTPATINKRQAAVNALYAELFPEPVRPSRPAPATGPAAVSDETIIAKARAAANGAKFDRLMAGDTSMHNGDDSASGADLALCGMLTFWTQDAAQIERIWQASKLSDRAKFDRADYRAMTIDRALSKVTNIYPWVTLEPLPHQAADPSVSPIGDTGRDADELRRELAAMTADRDCWQARAIAAEARADEARRLNLATQRVLANPATRTLAPVAVALAHELASTPAGRLDADGYAPVYVGHGATEPAGLAARAGVSPHTASRAVKALADLGAVEITHVLSDTGQRQTRVKAPGTVAAILETIAAVAIDAPSRGHGGKRAPRVCDVCPPGTPTTTTVTTSCTGCGQVLDEHHQEQPATPNVQDAGIRYGTHTLVETPNVQDASWPPEPVIVCPHCRALALSGTGVRCRTHSQRMPTFAGVAAAD